MRFAPTLSARSRRPDVRSAPSSEPGFVRGSTPPLLLRFHLRVAPVRSREYPCMAVRRSSRCLRWCAVGQRAGRPRPVVRPGRGGVRDCSRGRNPRSGLSRVRSDIGGFVALGPDQAPCHSPCLRPNLSSGVPLSAAISRCPPSIASRSSSPRASSSTEAAT